jgi:hypothetical protein
LLSSARVKTMLPAISAAAVTLSAPTRTGALDVG